MGSVPEISFTWTRSLTASAAVGRPRGARAMDSRTAGASRPADGGPTGTAKGTPDSVSAGGGVIESASPGNVTG